ncbi:MAG: DUF5606 domain-containing protein [Saprospiraceae bacterium]
MQLTEILSVSGLPGLYRMAASRKNGLIIEDLSSKKRRFAPSRTYQFLPLASISIYTTDSEGEPLDTIFRRMLEQYEDNPPVSPSASSEDLYEYLADVLPNFDRDRVYAGDIKKLIKWFTLLHELNLLTEDEEEE